jgi:hypothetical protein
VRGVLTVLAICGCGRLHFDPRTDAADAADNSGPNRVFVSSTKMTGDLGGRSGADATCQGLADSVGLTGEFGALLWDGLSPPSTNLAGARGWVTTTGVPVADLATDFDQPASTLNPIAYDESGIRVDDLVWIGQSSADCGGWASPGSAAIGGITRTWSTLGWYQAVSLPCTSPTRMMCAERDRVVPVAPIATTGRIAFVTTGTFTPGGGLAAADQMCANEASAAGLPGTYLAWLGSSAGGPETRFGPGEPWRRVDGVRLAETADALLSTDDTSYLDTFLNRTATGAFWIGDKTWTGVGGVHCSDWTATSTGDGTMANPGSTSLGEFRHEFTFMCLFGMELICMQT